MGKINGNTSKGLLFNKKDNDECYTPRSVVESIIPHVRAWTAMRSDPLVIWCPFDTRQSQFVKVLRRIPGVKVVHSHVWDGKDFFYYEPDHWDIIISNPPFKNKRQFFERALSFKKPFALLMTTTWLVDATPFKIFKQYGGKLQFIFFDYRVQYIDIFGRDMGRPTFSSAFFCNNFLPDRDIDIVHRS